MHDDAGADRGPLIGLLGPVVLLDADGSGEHTELAISSRRVRTLLATLALAHPHPRSAERLVADVWPDQPPKNPTGALHTVISRLRRALGAQSVTATSGGYRLTLPGPVSDLALAEAACGTRSADAVTQALGLWRGEPATGLPAGEVADRLRRRAQTAHRRLREANWNLHIADDPASVAADVELERRRTPLDEHLAAVQMRALVAAGDPNAALSVHATIRTLLAETLGTDPGPELAAAHSAALTYSPLPHTPAPPADDYVENAVNTERLHAALAIAPVVTVLGPGGIGKTRLVTEYIAARRPADVFIDLSAARDPGDVAAAVAAALHRGTLPDQPGVRAADRSGPAAAIAALAPARAVVVFDTCEHLLPTATSLINEIRSRREDLRIIATSRVALDIADEHTVTIEPLPTERGAELLARRARAVRADVHLDPALVDELCIRLDGSPLALELAAAQLRYLTLPDVVSRLDRRFGLLAVPGTGRHHTLTDVVAASWDLLSPDAERALLLVAQFPGDVRIDDALSFTGVTIAALAELCDHSLATVVEHPDGITRHRITETVREFARSRLASDPELAAELTDEFSRWAAALLAGIIDDLLAGRVAQATARLDESADTLLDRLDEAAHRAAGGVDESAAATLTARLLPVIAWRMVRTGGYDHAPRLARAVARDSGRVVSGTDDARGRALGLALSTATLAVDSEGREAARARSSLRRITATTALPESIRLGIDLLLAAPGRASRLLADAASSRDPMVVAVAEIIRSDLSEFRAMPVMSRRSALRALVAAERAGHPWLVATTRQRLGRGCMLFGVRAEAALHFARSAEQFAHLGLTDDAAAVRVHQALAVTETDPELATELLNACLREFGDTGRPFVATAHAALAQLRVTTDPAGARRAADTAIEIIGPPHDGHSAFLHGVAVAVAYRTGARTDAKVHAESLATSLSWLAVAESVNLPALGAAAAAIAMANELPADHRLVRAARAARYRRDFGIIGVPDAVGADEHARRTDLITMLRNGPHLH